MNSYKTNREWADSHMQDVKNILLDQAAVLLKIEVADEYIDTKQSTDMVVNISGGNVAVRMRRGGNLRYSDLTIRSFCHGGKTELAKLREGFADWYLYIWYDDKETVQKYILVDMNKLRQSEYFYSDLKEIPNQDGTRFVAFGVKYLNRIGALAGYMNIELPPVEVPDWKHTND